MQRSATVKTASCGSSTFAYYLSSLLLSSLFFFFFIVFFTLPRDAKRGGTVQVTGQSCSAVCAVAAHQRLVRRRGASIAKSNDDTNAPDAAASTLPRRAGCADGPRCGAAIVAHTPAAAPSRRAWRPRKGLRGCPCEYVHGCATAAAAGATRRGESHGCPHAPPLSHATDRSSLASETLQ